MNYQNIIEDKYTPQGLTIIEDNYFISAYKKHSPSRIYIYNKDKCLGKIILDNKAHVGGISYLKEHNIILVTGTKGTINAYNYLYLKKYFKKDYFTLDLADLNKEQYKVPCTINITPYGSAASVFYYDNYLYINTFNGYRKGKLFKIKMYYSKENNIISKIGKPTLIKIPPRIQGLSIIKYKHQEHLILSKSLSKTSSYLYIYKYLSTLKYLGKYKLPHPGAEGFIIDNDILTIIYETYSNNSFSISLEKLFNNLTKAPDIKDKVSSFISGIAYEYSKKK